MTTSSRLEKCFTCRDMHPPHPPGTGYAPKTTVASLLAPTGRWWLPRRDERLALTNILLLLALPLLGYATHLYQAARTYDLSLPVQSDRPAAVRVFLNVGAGYQQADPPTTAMVESPNRPLLVHADIPAGRLLGLSLHFDRAPGAKIRLGEASIRARGDDDEPAIRVPLQGWHARNDGPRVAPGPGGSVSVEIPANPTDADAQLDLAWTVLLPSHNAAFAQDLALGLGLYLATVFGALLAWRRLLETAGFPRRADRVQAALERGWTATSRTIRARPLPALWLAAAAGVATSCYPVVFCGKSFMSPNICGYALYDTMPTLPGETTVGSEDAQGSDTEASLAYCFPNGVMERRTLLRDGEFPLWNRYSAASVPLLGQGQSMIGDPLHWIVILLGANSGAWDLKFLLARLLFAAGVGLGVRAATGRLAAALLLAFSTCFLGFFAYRFDHPAYFSVCYSPWILYAWLEIARERGGPGTRRRAVRWTSLLLLANWMEFTSGTVKEASMLIAGLNATGLLIFALSDARPTLASKARTLAGLVWAGGCFVLVSAPLWHSLFDAIAHSWNNYIQPRAYQIQPGLLLGLFDDIFYRQFNHNEHVLDPSVNFVVLLGVAFAAVSFRTLARAPVFLALSLGALPLLALVFGVVPSSWITAVPFLGNITHIDNTFSCLLIIHLFVLAGFGLERCRERMLTPGWGEDFAWTLAVVGLLLAMFLGLTQARQRSDFNPLAVGEVPLSPFFRWYVGSLLAAFVALPLLWRQLRRDRGACVWGVAPWLVVCLAALLWRGGQQTHAVAELGRYVSHPPDRVNLLGFSPAVARLQARSREEPGRCLGLGDNLVPGFMAVYGLESPSGPDALQNRWYHALLTDSHLPLLWNWRLAADRGLATAALRFYDMLNVRFYADSSHGPAPDPLPGTHSLGHDDLDLYESDTAWPRAFFTDALAVSNGSKDFFALLIAGDGRPFAVVSPEALAGPDGASMRSLLRGDGGGETRAVVPASGYRLGNRTTTFHVHAPGPGVAALLESYQEPANVRVEVNGRVVPSFRVNEAFSGVFLPAAGDYKVSFRYGPRSLPLLLGANALGLTLLAGTAVWMWRQDRQPQPRFAV